MVFNWQLVMVKHRNTAQADLSGLATASLPTEDHHLAVSDQSQYLLLPAPRRQLLPELLHTVSDHHTELHTRTRSSMTWDVA